MNDAANAPGTQRALWIATLMWVVGMTTVFPIWNDALEAVSVFTLDRIAWLVVVALCMAAVVRDPTMLRGWGWVEALMALSLGVALASWLSTVSAKSPDDLKRDLNLFLTALVMPFMAFVIARHCMWTAAQRLQSLRVLVVVIATFLIAVGCVQGLIDWRFLVAEAHQAVHQSRARGPFDNAVPYTLALSLIIPIAIGLYSCAAGPGRLPWVAICVGMLEALLLGQTRVVWIGVPVALIYFAIVCRRVRRPALTMAVAMVAAVALSAVGIDQRVIASTNGAAAQPRGTTSERIGNREPMYHRVAVWGTALNMVAHRPLVGFGFGARTFVSARDPYYASCCGVSAEWAVPCAVPHNEILNLLVLMGATGLFAYGALLFALWQLLATEAADSVIARAAQVGLIVLVLAAQAHDVMYLEAVQVLFFFIAGLAVPVLSTPLTEPSA